jgi:hypothetical protein
MENKTIEALEKLIALKEETIKELERQVQLFKNQPPIVVPQQPIQPIQQPLSPWPFTQPYQPTQFPWGTVIITSTSDGGSISFTGDPLPLGSQQMTHCFSNNVVLPNNVLHIA